MSRTSTRTHFYPNASDTSINANLYRDLHELLDVNEEDEKSDGTFWSLMANKNLYFLYATRLSPQSVKEFKKYRQIQKVSRCASTSGLVIGSVHLFSSAYDAQFFNPSSFTGLYRPSWFTVMTGCLTLSAFVGSIALNLYAASYRSNVVRQEELETAIEDARGK